MLMISFRAYSLITQTFNQVKQIRLKDLQQFGEFHAKAPNHTVLEDLFN